MTQNAQPDVVTEAEKTLFGFWWTVSYNCLAIAHYQPDCVIGLAHGGILPAKATETAWRELTGQPFPPALYANIGREKGDRYRAEVKHRFYGTMSSLPEVVHFLDWLKKQDDWLDGFRQQIERVQGRPPESIVIIDEMIAQGNTLLFALGMLEHMYPTSVSYFLDGPHFDWRTWLSQYWLFLHYPEIHLQLQEQMAIQEYDLSHALYVIASGTEDIEPDLLTYRSLTPDNEWMTTLTQYLPFERWAEMPTWIENQVLTYVSQQAGQTSLDAVKQLHRWREFPKTSHISPYLLLRHINRWGQITLVEGSALLGVSEDEVRQELDHLLLYLAYEDQNSETGPVARMRTSAGITYGYVDTPSVPEPPIRESKRRQVLKHQLVRQRHARLRTARRRRGK